LCPTNIFDVTVGLGNSHRPDVDQYLLVGQPGFVLLGDWINVGDSRAGVIFLEPGDWR